MSIRSRRPRHKSTDARMAPEQRRLRRARGRMGLSQVEMADRLGIALSRLQSYEYGRTRTVPPEIMDRLRVLEAGREGAAVADFAGKPIAEIARGWMRRLGIRSGSCAALAAVLQLDRSTVSRWFGGRQQPDPRTIAEYERVVMAVEQALARLCQPAQADPFAAGYATQAQVCAH